MNRIVRNGPRRACEIAVSVDEQAGEFVLRNAGAHALMGDFPRTSNGDSQARYIEEFGQDCFRAGYHQALRDLQNFMVNGNPPSLV